MWTASEPKHADHIHADLLPHPLPAIRVVIPARFLKDTGTAPPRRREEGAIKLSFPVDNLDRVRRATAIHPACDTERGDSPGPRARAPAARHLLDESIRVDAWPER